MKEYRYSKETIDKCIELYLEGYNAKEVAEKLELDAGTILKYLKLNNLKIRRTKISKGMVEKVCKDYIDGFSQEETSERNHISRPLVRRILKENNIPIRRDFSWLKKYDIDENYFSTIDTQNKAYFLGFMYADGNVSKDENTVQICLQDRDLHILESFKRELKCTDRPLYLDKRNEKNVKHRNMYCLAVKSDKLHNDLCKLGVIPHKTHVITYPNFLSYDMHRHFIRGVMDGDGCIHATRLHTEKELRSVDICGTYDFCCELKKIIENNLDIHCSIILTNKTSNVYKTVISGLNQCVKFLDWIYEDAELYLYRKYELYLSNYKNAA